MRRRTTILQGFALIELAIIAATIVVLSGLAALAFSQLNLRGHSRAVALYGSSEKMYNAWQLITQSCRVSSNTERNPLLMLDGGRTVPEVLAMGERALPARFHACYRQSGVTPIASTLSDEGQRLLAVSPYPLRISGGGLEPFVATYTEVSPEDFRVILGKYQQRAADQAPERAEGSLLSYQKQANNNYTVHFIIGTRVALAQATPARVPSCQDLGTCPNAPNAPNIPPAPNAPNAPNAPPAVTRPAAPPAVTRPVTEPVATRPATPPAVTRPVTPPVVTRPVTPPAVTGPSTVAGGCPAGSPAGGGGSGRSSAVSVSSVSSSARSTNGVGSGSVSNCTQTGTTGNTVAGGSGSGRAAAGSGVALGNSAATSQSTPGGVAAARAAQDSRFNNTGASSTSLTGAAGVGPARATGVASGSVRNEAGTTAGSASRSTRPATQGTALPRPSSRNLP